MIPQNETAFVPALIVVDMQEDFCPPVSLDAPG
jgi:nicotinamidase-related amidase